MSEDTDRHELTVYFDGTCPLCRVEMDHFRRVTNPEEIRFEDVSRDDAIRPVGFSQEQLLARFHVQGADGTIVSGAPAFARMWSHAPGWRWLAWLSKIPGMLWMMEQSYRAFLRLRPDLVALLAPVLRRRSGFRSELE